MAKGNFDRCLKEVLLHEGGYVNHPRDPGGRTNLGVTQRVYEDWVGHPVNEAIMRGLTVDHVRALYKKNYWDKVRGDEIPAGLDLCVFDFAVNAGPARAARYLQRLVGAKQDGVIGPQTMSLLAQLVKGVGANHCILRYQDMRRDYYKQLNTFPTFGRGWLRRVAEVEGAAAKMVSSARA
jgi:lysozyme family protein